ncbi:MAG: helix-turn-helix transcriptional regulator, partial [Cytophagaceae bacterium]|nr:helix-turn-helix transcriptional regulator [Cytophagaceae bacterium]
MRKLDITAVKKRILAARKKLELSQEELGGRFKMSRAGYSAAENPTNERVFFTPAQLLHLKYELDLSYDF